MWKQLWKSLHEMSPNLGQTQSSRSSSQWCPWLLDQLPWLVGLEDGGAATVPGGQQLLGALQRDLLLLGRVLASPRCRKLIIVSVNN